MWDIFHPKHMNRETFAADSGWGRDSRLILIRSIELKVPSILGNAETVVQGRKGSKTWISENIQKNQHICIPGSSVEVKTFSEDRREGRKERMKKRIIWAVLLREHVLTAVASGNKAYRMHLRAAKHRTWAADAGIEGAA